MDSHADPLTTLTSVHLPSTVHTAPPHPQALGGLMAAVVLEEMGRGRKGRLREGGATWEAETL